ncbi:tellurite resistance TerB family protein [Larsenimonas salina]|uniref:tellurite resistance TerB family protein n=1 Tax=Larsenimonas salina TaxID=1295565 RepID=UPI0020731CCD|nr:tellurite resistance TerB family protein [Larsenimonas salina]MCM5704542.1 tellurite resistance TerB family protein [Larsenimonas salina]
MNAQKILSQLMKQATKHTASSSAVKKSGFDVSSLVGSGALGMLVGSKRGRSMAGKGLKYGALAGLGALAWKAWQAHQSSGDTASTEREGQPLEQLSETEQERRSRVILKAMIAAARADGHIDAEERAALTEQIDALGADDELHAWVEQQMSAPLDADALAQDVDSPQAAREVYLASVAIVDEQNAMERAWLDQLRTALSLDEAVCQTLEREARAD